MSDLEAAKPPVSSLRSAAAVVGGYALLLAWVFRQVWWGGTRGHRFFGWDCLREYWPDLVFGLHALRDGELPLWNPWSLGGYSFIGDIQAGMLAPLNWLLWGAAVLLGNDGPWLIQAKVLLGFVIGLTGMHLLVHRHTRSPVAGAIAACAFVFGSPLLVHKNGAFLWPLLYLPWAILALERVVEKPSVRRGILLGAALWLCGSAGHPQGFFYDLVVLLPYWLFLTLSPLRETLRSLSRQWRGLLAATVTALLLLLPIYVPAAEAVARSPRSERTLQWVLQLPLAPSNLRELLLPNLDNNWMLDVYVGALVLVLAIVAVAVARSGREVRHRVFWLAVAIFGLALALGEHTPVLPWAAEHVPGFDLFRIAYRHKVIFGFAAALLAGLGAGALLRGRWSAWNRFLLAWLAVGWLLLALGAYVGWWWQVATGQPAAAVSATLWLTAPALALVVAATWDRRRAPLWVSGAALLLLADLLHAGESKLDILQPPPEPRRDLLVIRPLEGAGSQWRYFNDGLLPHFTPYLNEVREFSGFSNPVQLQRHLDVMMRARRNPAMLGRFNVRWFLSRRPPRGGGMREVAPFVHEIPDPTPLVRVYPRAELLPAKAILGRLAAPPPLDVALVDPADRPPALPVGQGEPVAGRVARFSRNRIVVEVDSPWPGIAVINEASYPGWRATVNGRPTRMFRANYLLRAVVVPAGRSRIELTFTPRGFYALMGGFLLGLLAVVAALWSPFPGLDGAPGSGRQGSGSRGVCDNECLSVRPEDADPAQWGGGS